MDRGLNPLIYSIIFFREPVVYHSWYVHKRYNEHSPKETSGQGPPFKVHRGGVEFGLHVNHWSLRSHVSQISVIQSPEFEKR